MSSVRFRGETDVVRHLKRVRELLPSITIDPLSVTYYRTVGKDILQLQDRKNRRLMRQSPGHYSPVPAWSRSDVFYPKDPAAGVYTEAELIAARDRFIRKKWLHRWLSTQFLKLKAQLQNREPERQARMEADERIWRIGNDTECLQGIRRFEQETGKPLSWAERFWLDIRYRTFESRYLLDQPVDVDAIDRARGAL